jgi:hypothetical protein
MAYDTIGERLPPRMTSPASGRGLTRSCAYYKGSSDETTGSYLVVDEEREGEEGEREGGKMKGRKGKREGGKMQRMGGRGKGREG